MLGKDARLRNRRRELRQFLDEFSPAPDKPRQKFLRQAVWGILMSCSLVVARWLRWLGGADRCRKRFWRHKRLLDQLKSQSPRWRHDALIDRYLRAWAAKVQPDTPLILDLCDLAKPRATTLKYLALVRDGSARDRDDRPRLVNGYWCLEAYAYWGKGRITPLLLHPYSIEDPQIKGENAVILDRVDRLMNATGGKGVLVMDAGADRDHLLLPWIDKLYPFVVRIKSGRHLLLQDGTRISSDLLADTLLANAARKHPGRHVAWCKVFLPERPDRPLHLVVKSRKGQDRPIILLTTLTAENLDTAKSVLSYYRKRWKCEESARFLKTDLGLERFALRTYEAFPRLLFLAALAMAFLTWLQLHLPSLPKWLCNRAPGRRKIKFAYYRLLDWFQDQILLASMRPCPP